MRRPSTAAAALALTALLALPGCSGDGDADDHSSPTPSTPPPAASAPPKPKPRACYRLTYAEAVAPTSAAKPVDCESAHTARTLAVGRLRTLADGHLLAVDSSQVQRQVAGACPARFAEYVGGSPTDRRLSMLRPVWFTPTVEDSDLGAEWFRCDVIALAADEKLMRLTGRLTGVLSTPSGRDRFGMCSPAAPDDKGFAHVACSSRHAWRAVAVVDIKPGRRGAYPGAPAVREQGQGPCEDAGAEAGGDELSYRWGYEAPTQEQWEAGQTFGRCWVPVQP